MKPLFSRWLALLALSCGGAIFLAAAVGFTYEQIGRWKDARAMPPRIGQAVDIGGRSINLLCSGSGSPTVVFESGAGNPGYSWFRVQPGVAQFARACWYDRAGEGWSDTPPAPGHVEDFSADLHDALSHGGIAPPYILVGHSLGGQLVRLYTANFPDDVIGLVLVDSAHPDQNEPAFMKAPTNLMSPTKRELLCKAWPAMDRLGLLRFMGFFGTRPVPPQLGAEQRVIRALRSQRKAFETGAARECADTDGGVIVPQVGEGNPEIDNAVRHAGSLGDRPLIVLTAGKYIKPPNPADVPQAAAFQEVWIHQLQADLARLSTSGKQVIVENSDHGIPSEAPEAVIRAVQEIVNDIRSLRPSG